MIINQLIQGTKGKKGIVQTNQLVKSKYQLPAELLLLRFKNVSLKKNAKYSRSCLGDTFEGEICLSVLEGHELLGAFICRGFMTTGGQIY